VSDAITGCAGAAHRKELNKSEAVTTIEIPRRSFETMFPLLKVFLLDHMAEATSITADAAKAPPPFTQNRIVQPVSLSGLRFRGIKLKM
jgi:hypothetical protein